MAIQAFEKIVIAFILFGCGSENSKYIQANSKLDSINSIYFTDTTAKTKMKHNEIIEEFKKQYGYLSKYGLQINGIGNLIAGYNVISISTPFIFDRTKLPEKFMGLDLRNGTNENEMPMEFQNIDKDKEYIWAYQRFEDYVDNHHDLIRKTLDNPGMTRDEMLNALCFGDFNNHKELCIKWENEGKIPKWKTRNNH
jgi:hypothetical protein